MLTRCKMRLIIVTNKTFLQSDTMKETLLGKMCTYWEEKHGVEYTWWDEQEVLNPPESALTKTDSEDEGEGVESSEEVVSMIESDSEDEHELGTAENPITFLSDSDYEEESDKAAKKSRKTATNALDSLTAAVSMLSMGAEDKPVPGTSALARSTVVTG